MPIFHDCIGTLHRQRFWKCEWNAVLKTTAMNWFNVTSSM